MNRNVAMAGVQPPSKEDVRRTSSFSRMASAWTESRHESTAERLTEPPTLLSWWQPFSAAACGSHNALQNSEALGPAANIKTIDSTVARNTTTLTIKRTQDECHKLAAASWENRECSRNVAQPSTGSPAGFFARAPRIPQSSRTDRCSTSSSTNAVSAGSVVHARLPRRL